MRASDTALHASEGVQRAVIPRRRRYHHGGSWASTRRGPRVERNMNTNELRGGRLRPRSSSAVQESAGSLENQQPWHIAWWFVLDLGCVSKRSYSEVHTVQAPAITSVAEHKAH